jgi:DNA-binding MarR family transcriptional regulator
MNHLDPFCGSTWRFFLTAHSRLLTLVEKRLSEANLPSLDWYDVLFVLKESPEHRLRLSEVADKVLISRSNLTRLIDRLESAELLQRKRCPNDRRGAYAVLTDAGIAMQQKMWEVYSQCIADYFCTHLDAEEVEVLHRVLTRILVSLDESDANDFC